MVNIKDKAEGYTKNIKWKYMINRTIVNSLCLSSAFSKISLNKYTQFFKEKPLRLLKIIHPPTCSHPFGGWPFWESTKLVLLGEVKHEV